MPTPKRTRPDHRPISHLVAAVPLSRPEVEQEACQACGGDCAVVREGTPRFGLWSWLRCLRCAWHDRPAVDANGDGVHGAEF